MNSIMKAAEASERRSFAQFGTSFKTEEATKNAKDVISRIRTTTVDLVDDIDIIRDIDPDTGVASRIASVRGRCFMDTKRLETSVTGLLGASLSNLNWIGYRDMASRILQTKAPEARDARLTYIEGPDGEIEQPLAVTPVGKDFVDPAFLMEKLDPEFVAYNDGSLIMTATPTDLTSLSIMGDAYNPSSFLRLPVDGYGDVHRFLGFLRVLCSNGAVLMDKNFSEVIKNSNDKFNAIFSSLRTVPTDMAQKIHNRMLQADKTLISGREFRNLVEALVLDRRAARTTVAEAVTVTGSDRSTELDKWFSSMLVLERNVLADNRMNLGTILKGDLDILGAVGCKATVLDTVNMITELSTHHIGRGFATNNHVSSAVAKLLAKSRFNLEGKLATSERRDFWFTDEALAEGATAHEVMDLIETAKCVNN